MCVCPPVRACRSPARGGKEVRSCGGEQTRRRPPAAPSFAQAGRGKATAIALAFPSFRPSDGGRFCALGFRGTSEETDRYMRNIGREREGGGYRDINSMWFRLRSFKNVLCK